MLKDRDGKRIRFNSETEVVRFARKAIPKRLKQN
jgi:hypothetical protein